MRLPVGKQPDLGKDTVPDKGIGRNDEVAVGWLTAVFIHSSALAGGKVTSFIYVTFDSKGLYIILFHSPATL